MDTSKLKKFASYARTSLIEQVGTRLKTVLAEQSLARRENAAAVAELEKKIKELGKERVIEMVAYTWFNRFCALRFMDVNQYTTIGTVSPAEGFTQPEILTEAKQGVIDEELKVDRAKVIGLLDGTRPSQDAQGEVYQQLLIAVCNSYHKLMPFMFEKIADYTELLIPEALLSDSSVLSETRKALTAENCADVEVIGWLYQFYISEKKDDVFAALKKGKKITPENIPAATQLFTPHWIVRYLVENSLGRLWMLNHPKSKLVERMDYYIKPEETETDFLKIKSPEEIKICDPACGSGHMLTYAFDLLYTIYEEQGYQAVEIPRLILKHNLYGVEIDQRAGALAAFALVMKAREKDRRFFTRKPLDADSSAEIQSPKSQIQNPNICILENVQIERDEYENYLHGADGANGLLSFCKRATPIVFGQVDEASCSLPTLMQILELCDYTKQSMQFAHMLIVGGSYFSVQNRKMLRRNKTLRRQLFIALRTRRPLVECSDPVVTDYFRREFRKAALNGELLPHCETIDLAALVSDFYFQLFNQYREADNFGSLIRPLVTDVSDVLNLLRERKVDGDLFLQPTHRKILRAMQQADYLSPKYHVVVANPPYMGGRNMNPDLKDYVASLYEDFKSDLFSAFIARLLEFVVANGNAGFMTPFTWMFLSSYSDLRTLLIKKYCLTSLIRPEYHSFFDSAYVPLCAFSVTLRKDESFPAVFIDLNRFYGVDIQPQKALEAITNPNCEWRYSIPLHEFASIPGTPLAYDLPRQLRGVFSRAEQLSTVANPKQGLATADNERFLRFWHEVSSERTGFGLDSSAAAKESAKKWFPYQKGGTFRKWYGNHEFVIDWENDGQELRDFKKAVIRNPQYYFREGMTWTSLTVASFNGRFCPQGFVFDSKGPVLFTQNPKLLKTIIGYMNSSLVNVLLKIFAPTLDYNQGPVGRLPYTNELLENRVTIEPIVDELIEIAKADWDDNEFSWDFQALPIIAAEGNESLEQNFHFTRARQRRRVSSVQRLEEENSRQVLATFKIDEFSSYESSACEVTLFCNPLNRYDGDKGESELEALFLADTMREFISYSVGCMFGRYSLDKPGLILANKGETVADYLRKLHRETTPINPQLAIEDPRQVVFLSEVNVHCFGCNRAFPATNAFFAVDAEFDDAEAIKTTALLYCDDCFKGHKPGHLIHSQKLKHFSIQNTLSRNWCDSDSLKTFLKRANCFAHPVPLSPQEVNVLPEEDNVLPLLDGDWFDDDITERFKAFLKVTFGTEHYEENLKFLEDALYPDNLTAKKRKTIREYFLKDFYNHHIKLYKKRPIYWLFSSPKGTFNALIYMHRYRPDTVGTVLHYLRDFRDKLTHHAEHQQMLADSASTSKSEKTQAIKDVAAIKKQLKELEDYEKTLFEVAARKIDIDLDDGVKHNYQLFGSVLRKIPGLDAKEE